MFDRGIDAFSALIAGIGIGVLGMVLVIWMTGLPIGPLVKAICQ